MEELIFFAIIIFFSIIDSIARRKKKKQQAGTLPAPDAEQEWEWEQEEYPTYDSDPSYDETHEERIEEAPRQLTTSSEGMIPSELWEEIAGLAQGRARQLEKREPDPPSPARSPRPPVEVRAATHRVHLAHAGYGTDPSERAPSEQDGLDPLAKKLSADAAAVRGQLRREGRSALRQAVILQEVLGPPAAAKPDRFEDL